MRRIIKKIENFLGYSELVPNHGSVLRLFIRMMVMFRSRQSMILSVNRKIDFVKIHPIIFEMQQTRYLRSGDATGFCWDMGKTLKVEQQENKNHNN